MISILECIERLSRSFPLNSCSSSFDFQAILPVNLPRISGFEFKPGSPKSDFLSCFSISELSYLKDLIERSDLSAKEGAKHLNVLKQAISILEGMPELQCISDHMWVEIDSNPNTAISFFLGSDNQFQTLDEKISMLEYCQEFHDKLREAFSWSKINTTPYLERLTNIFGDISDLTTGQIGFMGRANMHQHAKILLTSKSDLDIPKFIEICFPKDSHKSGQDSRIPSIMDLIYSSPVKTTVSISLALYDDVFKAALEVLPVFSSNEEDHYTIFWDQAKKYFEQDLANAAYKDVIWMLHHKNHEIYSKLHHLKFYSTPAGNITAKFYRDLRINKTHH